MESAKNRVEKARSKTRPYYGWWILLASSVMGAAGAGLTNIGFPVFFLPIRRELVISTTAMSLVFSLARAQSGIVAPLVGWLADKLGTRRLVLWGGLMSGAGLILLSRGNSLWHLLLFYSVIVAVGRTASISPTLMATVNQWFVRRKALTLSILQTSFTIGGALLVPLLSLGSTHLGWRPTLLYGGIFLCLLTLPVFLVLRNRPEELGLLPDGDGPVSGQDQEGPAQSAGGIQDFSVRQALSTPAFWLLLLGLVLRVSVADVIVIHQIPMLVWKGASEQAAAFYLSLSFMLMIPLRLGLGISGDYLSPRLILFAAMSVGGLGTLAFLVLEGQAAIIPLVVGLAIIEGVAAVNWIAVGDYFGRRYFASLMGIMTVFHSMGSLILPVVSGWIFDQTQSYTLVLLIVSPLLLVSGVAFALARRPLPPSHLD